ncbi:MULTISPECIES: GIY-YIG nuclease family protein [Salinimonas]|uniref:GIY-YIG nuclease family protein n=2 Tax=Salinimonas TaxID=288793 RepID=A0A5B7YJ63_9ALTE|nr:MULTISPECIES: GIY-YIG nuclease family protein [Salinimonas]MBD3587517.1 GIY-YIG nuclease family protein [Salinimonas profundi]QCZ95571.1 GIY-YIG nuclease family protein [Salinimonas iocasae]
MYREYREYDPNKKSGFVYLIETPCLPNWVKIGFSNHPERRIKGLNTAVPEPFRLIQAWVVNDYKAAETVCHKFFDNFRSESGTEHFRLQSGVERHDYLDVYTGVITDFKDRDSELISDIDFVLKDNGFGAEKCAILDRNNNILE